MPFSYAIKRPKAAVHQRRNSRRVVICCPPKGVEHSLVPLKDLPLLPLSPKIIFFCVPSSHKIALVSQSPIYEVWGRGGIVVERRTPELEVQGRTPQPPCSVLEKNTLISPQYWQIPRKWWFCPNMTEKLLTGMLNLNKPNQLSDICSLFP